MDNSPFSERLLTGKRILVTGASSGIGQATAMALSQAGATVILLGRDELKLKESISHLSGQGHYSHSFDLAQTEEIPTLLQQIAQEQGPLDGLFHSAGLALIKPVKLLKPEEIRHHFAVTFDAFLMLVKGITHRKVRAEGPLSLVAMSSVAGHRGQAGMSLYSGAKGALDAAVRSLAVELAPHRVNSIVGGAIQTPMHDEITAPLPAESVSTYESRHLLKFGEPQDIATAAVYLLSDASKWVTGTQLVIDGGYVCQ